MNPFALIEIVDLVREVAEANRHENYNPSVSYALEKILEERGIDKALLTTSEQKWSRIKRENLIEHFYEPTRKAS